MQASYSSLEHGWGMLMISTGRPNAVACFSISTCRVACMATRFAVAFTVVKRPVTFTVSDCCSRHSENALSLPLLQLIQAFFVMPNI